MTGARERRCTLRAPAPGTLARAYRGFTRVGHVGPTRTNVPRVRPTCALRVSRTSEHSAPRTPHTACPRVPCVSVSATAGATYDVVRGDGHLTRRYVFSRNGRNARIFSACTHCSMYTPAAIVAYRYRGRGERCSAGHRRFKKKGKTMYYTGTSQYYSRPLLSIDQPSFFVDGLTD